MRPVSTERPALTKAAEVAGILGGMVGLVALVVAFLAWLDPRSPAEKDEEASQAVASVEPSMKVEKSSAPAAEPPLVLGGSRLNNLEISSGRENARAPSKGAIAIACATGETRDQYREVRYLANAAYQDLRVTLASHATRSAPAGKPLEVQVEIIADREIKAREVLPAETRKVVEVDIAGSETLGIRVTCSRREAVLLIEDSSLS